MKKNYQNKQESLIPLERIVSKIFWMRGQKVMLDSDLAELYGVETKVLNQAVKRNVERFPEDFMFRLTDEEVVALRSQFSTLNKLMASEWDNNEVMRSQIVTASKRNVRYLPYVFTEHGVAMLSSILKSERAIKISIFIVRSFIQLRETLATSKELTEKIMKMERKYDRQFKIIFDVMQRVWDDGKKSKKLIGFK